MSRCLIVDDNQRRGFAMLAAALCSRPVAVGPAVPGERETVAKAITIEFPNHTPRAFGDVNVTRYEPRKPDDRSYYERTFARRR